jgi:hypothetical protein
MSDEIETILPAENETPPPEPQASMHGNGFDLTSLGALVSGVLLLFLCLTCNMGFYCLPLLPLVLGIIGLATASRSVDQTRSHKMAWVGLGSGVLAILLMIAGIVIYFALVALIILREGNSF